jgi:hypothetical protein
MSSTNNDKKPQKKDPYVLHLEKSYREIIDDLGIQDLQKRFLRDRWLQELLWFEKKAVYNQKRHYTLRLVTIVGGVVVPSLVGLSLKTSVATHAISWTTFSVSLVVAMAAALESFFGYGDRWRTFRKTVEALKAHGWQYFQLVGHYAGHADHPTAFPHFAAQVETLFQQDVEMFISRGGQQHTTPNPSGAEGPVAVVPSVVPSSPAT